MLINIDPILNPDILHTLQSMGHGDTLILSDVNFPAYSNNSRVHRLDGVDIARAAKAILSVFPLDGFIPSPVQRMEIDGDPEKVNEVHQDMIDAVRTISGEEWKVTSIERNAFYEATRKAYAVIATTENRPYGCFILTKGVILPDGSVWKPEA